MRNFAKAVSLACLMLLCGSCQMHSHRVGAGPSGSGSDQMRQYWIFFGLVEINEADSQRMTQDLPNYEIVTEFSFVDMLLCPILLPLTVTSRTIHVNR